MGSAAPSAVPCVSPPAMIAGLTVTASLGRPADGMSSASEMTTHATPSSPVSFIALKSTAASAPAAANTEFAGLSFWITRPTGLATFPGNVLASSDGRSLASGE